MGKIILQLLLVAGIISITGCNSGSVKDIEGNRYNTVKLGNQVWMSENLKTTKFNDGSVIPEITDNDTWVTIKTPAYSWYNNEKEENKKSYGALYNWNTVNTNKLCPTGWRVPTDQDWMTLVTFIDSIPSAGGKMKETGTLHWKSPNTGASNTTGFKALPGGYRSINGVFNYVGIAGYWWSATEYNSSSVLFYSIRYKSAAIYKARSEKFCGFSVRCIKDSK